MLYLTHRRNIRLWMVSILVALVLATLMTVAASHKKPAPLPAVALSSESEERSTTTLEPLPLLAFNEVWPEDLWNEVPPRQPKIVKTVSIKEDPIEIIPEARVYHQRQKSHDICRGKGRVYHNQGRSWRCRR